VPVSALKEISSCGRLYLVDHSISKIPKKELQLRISLINPLGIGGSEES
jgi:hypothetical protein